VLSIRSLLSSLAWPGGGPGPPALLTVPALLVGAAMALPLAYLAVRSLGAPSEAWELFFRFRTAQILWRSILLVFVVTSGTLLVGVPLAWLTARTDMPMRRLLSVLVALPLVIPTYVGGFLAISALGPRGLVQGMLEPLGVSRLPEIYGLPGASMTLILLSYPYVYLTVRAALMRMDPSLDESALLLGHGTTGTFFRLTLPQLRPAMISGSLLVALYTLSDFGAVSLMRYESFTWAIYQQYQAAFARNIAAVLALGLVGLAAVVLIVESLARGRSRYYRSSSGSERSQSLIGLKMLRWPAAGLAWLVVLGALGLPTAVLGYWLVNGVSAGEPLLLLWSAAWNAVSVSVLAAVAAALLAIPVAAIAVRHPGLIATTVYRVSHTGYAMPGIVVALALVFFGSRLATPVYQTVWLLVFAYVILFLPAALGAVRSSLAQISPRLEESARVLGRSQMRVMLSVTGPLMRSGLLMGGALVFLVTMKELPATLILGPLGFKTLATAVWSASEEAFFARAAAPALMLILISSIPMAVLVLRERSVRK
jgi:iron(III) transport system permease protein